MIRVPTRDELMEATQIEVFEAKELKRVINHLITRHQWFYHDHKEGSHYLIFGNHIDLKRLLDHGFKFELCT